MTEIVVQSVLTTDNQVRHHLLCTNKARLKTMMRHLDSKGYDLFDEEIQKENEYHMATYFFHPDLDHGGEYYSVDPVLHKHFLNSIGFANKISTRTHDMITSSFRNLPTSSRTRSRKRRYETNRDCTKLLFDQRRR